MVNEIWVNRLVAGTQTWEKVPATRREAVKAILAQRVNDGQISAERFAEITGETLETDTQD